METVHLPLQVHSLPPALRSTSKSLCTFKEKNHVVHFVHDSVYIDCVIKRSSNSSYLKTALNKLS